MKNVIWVVLAVVTLAVGFVTLRPTGPAPEESNASSRHPAQSRDREPTRPRPRFGGRDTDGVPAAGYWLEGRIVDRERIAVRNAEVALDAVPPRVVKTDASGIFEFSDVAAGSYRVVARAPGGFAGPAHVIVTANTEPLELVLDPAATLLVRVVDGADVPVVGAQVAVRVGATLLAETDDSGTVAFTAVPRGQHPVSVRADGFADAEVRVPVAGSNGEAEVIVRLPRGVPVSGTVTDEAGRPVDDAQVRVVVAGRAVSGAVKTDADGKFELRAVAVAGLRLRASAQGYAPTQSPQLDRSALSRPVTLVVGPGRTLAGSVHDGHGDPVAEATVRASARGDLDDDWTTTTDQTGAFELVGVPGTAVELVALHRLGTSEPYPIEASDADRDSIALSVSDQGWIRGVAVDSEGEPVVNATVVARADAAGRAAASVTAVRTAPLETITDDGGRFALDGLVPGRYVLRTRTGVTGTDELGARRGVVAQTGSDDVELVVGTGGSLRGRVLDSRGQPVTRFQLRVDIARPRDVADAEGRFEVTGIDAGSHFVAIDAPGIRNILVENIQVTASEVTDLGVLRAESGGAVSGQVVDATGEPVSGAAVYAGHRIVTDVAGRTTPLGRGGEGGFDVAVSGVDGTFRIFGVDAGAQNVIARHPVHGSSRAVPISGSATGVKLVVGGDAAVTGQVLSSADPIADALVELVDADAPGVRRTASTDETGRFRFGDLAPGPYRIEAKVAQRADLHHSRSQRVELEAGAVGDVTLALTDGSATAEVSFGPSRTGPMRNALVLIAEGVLVASNAGELDASYLGTTGAAGSTISFGGAKVSIARLPPGAYTVCATWVEADPEDPIQLRRLQLEAESLPVSCRPVNLVSNVIARVTFD